MRNLVLGALLGATCVTTMVVWQNSIGEAHAQRATLAPASGELVTHQSAVDEHRQQLTIIDPQMRTACVYHIDRDTGELSLKSVRNFAYDLQMIEFNCTSPRPREIRAMLDQQ